GRVLVVPLSEQCQRAEFVQGGITRQLLDGLLDFGLGFGVVSEPVEVAGVTEETLGRLGRVVGLSRRRGRRRQLLARRHGSLVRGRWVRGPKLLLGGRRDRLRVVDSGGRRGLVVRVAVRHRVAGRTEPADRRPDAEPGGGGGPPGIPDTRGARPAGAYT